MPPVHTIHTMHWWHIGPMSNQTKTNMLSVGLMGIMLMVIINYHIMGSLCGKVASNQKIK